MTEQVDPARARRAADAAADELAVVAQQAQEDVEVPTSAGSGPGGDDDAGAAETARETLDGRAQPCCPQEEDR